MKTFALVLVTLVSLAISAPVKVSHRESTPQILDLEKELKAQAGEDKQYFPSKEIPPFPFKDLGSGDADGPDESEQELQQAAYRPIVVDALADDPSVIENHIKRADDPEEDQLQEEEEEGEDEEDEEAEGDDDDSSNEKDLVSSEEDQQMQDEEEYNEKLFLDTVMNTLKTHPEMIKDLLGEVPEDGEEDEEEQLVDLNRHSGSDVVVPPEVDKADLDEEIKAEILQAEEDARAKNDGPVVPQVDMDDEESESESNEFNNAVESRKRLQPEYYQRYQGDSSAREVAKKRGYARPDGLENAAGSYKYGATYPGSGGESGRPLVAQTAPQEIPEVAQDLDADQLVALKALLDQEADNSDQTLEPIAM